MVFANTISGYKAAQWQSTFCLGEAFCLIPNIRKKKLLDISFSFEFCFLIGYTYLLQHRVDSLLGRGNTSLSFKTFHFFPFKRTQLSFLARSLIFQVGILLFSSVLVLVIFLLYLCHQIIIIRSNDTVGQVLDAVWQKIHQALSKSMGLMQFT